FESNSKIVKFVVVKKREEQGASEEHELRSFEETMLRHLDASHNLARWLLRNEQDAQDVVQEAYLRALKSFGGFHGSDGRAWLLAIVRNTCYTWLQQKRVREPATAFDEEIHGVDAGAATPVTQLLRKEDKQAVHQAVEENQRG